VPMRGRGEFVNDDRVVTTLEHRAPRVGVETKESEVRASQVDGV